MGPRPRSDTPAAALARALARIRSADALEQNAGVAEAVALGGAALPGLVSLLAEEAADARAQAAYALSRIADPRAAQPLQRATEDPDERVRAYAAVGLARLGHPGALDACLATLDDAPDELHMDRTPSVEALGRMGLAAVPGLLQRLESPQDLTRLRAQRALELVVARRHGAEPGAAGAGAEALAAARREWERNGNYRWDADAPAREAALAKWRAWAAAAGGE